ncbi:NAD-specific glutamate dehydrogenase [uncultured Flavonifractor sp.]|uniref:Glutamate dehydrogenase n=1 Tax=Flintibacter hominis TaxID=2763048 RepID=A0A8J6J0Y9_9FIRM|nr:MULTISPECIES: NADP-specific glutamate dehydrogenase [Eubacteriales]MBS5589437.1 NADP-specific glutamate dehydrogenase [Clostridiales bacterium]SCH83749.1 NAD-specific glutamate dehydrogenase [uncultured Clostridium sp.]SCI72505.1 NAD-specific glutamate dehydrogenase [uncultured Flavonifractor sp.]MBC5722054.1 NADP-specific glutamate dehydrogenase [Flintibacter hominis]MCH1980681.1 NADP-specific glutamate dehydrogenase [Lawsonibacter sp. OA9]
MNKYIERVLADTKAKNANEPEFLQTVEEVLSSLEPVINAHPEYEKAALLERMVEPERAIEFRVTWEDDNHVWHVNRGYRVQYNAALGPYKGGIRFDPSVNLSIIKFLGFEQVFKDAMTGLPIGGAKGGSDFDPRGKSDAEVMRFCQAFITELYRHIGQDIDCPAGDLGCGGREIGYMYGQYRRIVGAAEFGALSGKAVCTGGSIMRPEATGFGAVYYLCEALKHDGESIEGKRIAMSGYGNVGWGIMKKAAELGAKVTYFAGPDGYIHDPDGVDTEEKLNYILEMRAKDPMHCAPYAERFGCEFVPNAKCWGVKDVDIYMPAATQNDVNLDWAKKIAESGVKYYIEVANMPTTNEALEFLKSQKHMVVAPSKAVNAGGVSVSELEMAQNAERLYWTAEEVDTKLKGIMKNIYHSSVEVAERYGLGYDLVAGANIVGFQKVADAMMAQGIF